MCCLHILPGFLCFSVHLSLESDCCDAVAVYAAVHCEVNWHGCKFEKMIVVFRNYVIIMCLVFGCWMMQCN